MMLHRARLITAGRPLLQPHTSPQAPGEATRASLMLIPAFGVTAAMESLAIRLQRPAVASLARARVRNLPTLGSPWASVGAPILEFANGLPLFAMQEPRGHRRRRVNREAHALMPPLRRMDWSTGSKSNLQAAAYRMTRLHLLLVRLPALAGSAVHRMTAANGFSRSDTANRCRRRARRTRSISRP